MNNDRAFKICSSLILALTGVLGTLETSEHVAHARFAPWPLTRFSTLTLAKFFVDSTDRPLTSAAFGLPNTSSFNYISRRSNVIKYDQKFLNISRCVRLHRFSISSCQLFSAFYSTFDFLPTPRTTCVVCFFIFILRNVFSCLDYAISRSKSF